MYIQQAKHFSIVLPVLLIVQSWFPCISGHKLGSIHLSDGALKLIIKTYINDLVSTYRPDDSLSNKLHQLSDHVANHPALYQKRLYIGPEPPTHDPILGDDQLDGGQTGLMAKRKTMKEGAPSEQFPSEEICPTNRQWEQLNKTHDLYDNEVEVMQAEGMTQFIYTYRCSSNKASSCVGISPLYNSECTERNGWVYMLYRKPEDEAPQWGYVAAPHHCACKIQPKIEATVPTTE